MPIFDKTPTELILKLVNTANTDLPFEITTHNAGLAAPVVIPNVPPSVADTEVLLSSLPDGEYYGNKKIQYRRINLTHLFKDIKPEVVKYTSVANGGSAFRILDLLPDFNKRWGMNLTADDVVDAWFPVSTDNYYPGLRTSKVIVNTKPTSKAYIGSFELRWVYTKRSLSNLVSITDIPGRDFPGGNVFDGTHKEVLNSLAWGLDFTDVMPVSGMTGGFYNDVAGIAILAKINQSAGTNLTNHVGGSNSPNNLYIAQMATYVLPNALFPEAKSQYFNRLVVITPRPDQAALWCAGALYLHYNV